MGYHQLWPELSEGCWSTWKPSGAALQDECGGELNLCQVRGEERGRRVGKKIRSERRAGEEECLYDSFRLLKNGLKCFAVFSCGPTPAPQEEKEVCPIALVSDFIVFIFLISCFLLCFVLFCFVLFCFVLFCFVLFCFVLFCFVLLCFALVLWASPSNELLQTLEHFASVYTMVAPHIFMDVFRYY